MTSSWFGGRDGRHGRQTDLAPARAALDGAAQALIDLDTRQGYVDDALRAGREFAAGGPGQRSTDLDQAWKPIAERSFEASAEYLDATARYPLTDAMGRDNAALDVEAARRAFIGAHRSMAGAAAEVDTFYSRHRERIEDGKRAMTAVPRQVDAARVAAQTATQQAAEVAGRDAALLDLRSVGAAMDALSAAASRLDAAGPLRDRQQAAEEVTQAAQAFTAALQDAPHLAERARAAIPSVRTRLDSLDTRMHRLPQALSSLWREFNQASSADLSDHGRRAERALLDARAELDKAEKAVPAGDPETAQASVTEARRLATDVSHLIDEVTGRLDRLREVERNPRAAEHPVRFAVRDAQRLVVDRGLTGEWGSVLDAQSTRLDRAVEALTGPHPDYWAMVTELTSVQSFVADVVERVRRQAHESAGRA